MQFALLTQWHLAAPIERVWDALVAVDEWPCWWRFAQSIVALEAGDANGIGARRRYVWSSRLPYRLSFEMRTTALQRPTLMEAIAAGDLNGVGRWRLEPDGPGTRVTYEWRVGTRTGWKHRLAPILAPVFRWNHNVVMAEGGRGLARHLGVDFIAMEAWTCK